MKAKAPIEVELAGILLRARSAIRARHSASALAEINRRLPEIEKAAWAALSRGQPYTLSLDDLDAGVSDD